LGLDGEAEQGSGAFVAGMEEMFGPVSAARKRRLLSADLEVAPPRNSRFGSPLVLSRVH
jgi:hypothetical protein